MAVFKRKWFMWDFARQRRFDREEFLLVINKLADLGYNGLGLYLEGAFELKCLGGGKLRKGVMTHEDAVWAKEKCGELGIFLFPMTNVVGHMEHFLRQQRFSALSSVAAPERDINFGTPEAKEFALKVVYEYLEAFDTDYIHIGGDEATLNDKNRPVYAEFLSNLCNELIADGKKIGIWADLLWQHKELVAPFSRDIELFDWWYYAHHAESIEFFKSEGFKNIIVCPSENSWAAFAGHQYARHWRSDEDQTPVTPDEVEAFLADGVKVLDDDKLYGMLTHWEATQGRDIWGQWSAIARSGLYMSGKLDCENADEQIEKAIFGRITPSTEIMHIIQNEIHSLFEFPGFVAKVRQSVFIKDMFFKGSMEDNDGRDKTALAEAPIRKIEKLLEGWTPEGEFEKRVYLYLVSIAALLRATFALRGAFFAEKELYTKAAIKQFSSPEEAKELVIKFAEGFDKAAELNREYKAKLKDFIAVSAHTETDYIRLDMSYKYTADMSEFLRELAGSPDFAEIPLPSLSCILGWVMNRAVIEK
ncbi:MAG: family 20 glycosylhydrolase [Clostridia bacterium]|nr:family 20 glycosylhydrolase [Clostridia bacterium]